MPPVRRRFAGALALVALGLGSVPALAQSAPGGVGDLIFSGPAATATPPQLEDVTFRQRLDTTLPLDLTFTDEGGHEVKLGSYFGRKPVLLSFVYYTCPMLCLQVMNGVSSALKVVPFRPGEDFEIVFISFDPRDTPQAATQKKHELLADYRQLDTADGWHFLTGDEEAIAKVTAAAGFSYRWIEEQQQFAHVSGILTATPDGRLSRYFYGVEYSPKELRMALVESGKGTIGSAVDELLLYCYHYDPAAGRYGAVAMNIVRLGGAVTVIILGGFIWLALRKDSVAVHA